MKKKKIRRRSLYKKKKGTFHLTQTVNKRGGSTNKGETSLKRRRFSGERKFVEGHYVNGLMDD